MSEGRSRADWATASMLAAFIANAHRGKGSAVSPAAINPWTAKASGEGGATAAEIRSWSRAAGPATVLKLADIRVVGKPKKGSHAR